MATNELPLKPPADAAAEPVRGVGPVKGKRAPAPKRARGSRAKPRATLGRREQKTVQPATNGPGRPEQRRRATRPQSGEAYVRLRVRVEDGELSLAGSRVVEGPLAQTPAFEGGYAYEVTDGERLLHAGAIPDLGVFRSFAHPDGTLEQRRHHTYELTSYEFHARVPREALSRQSLPRISIVLYRVKEHPAPRAAMSRALSPAPLGVQRERELREVGRLVGLPPSILGAGRGTRPQSARPRGSSAGRASRGPASKKR